MVTISEFESTFINIIDKCIKLKSAPTVKEDFSLVTEADKTAEEALIKYITNLFPDILIVSEENSLSHKDKYQLKDRFAVIDPIDGTENYFFTNQNYGSVVSVVYDDFKYHGIYIPSINKIISSRNISSYKSQDSSIKLLSTSCLENTLEKIDGSYQNYRVLGSSSYMFFLLLMGQANSFNYCGKAKIWDYFTGINLALEAHNYFDVMVDNKIIYQNWFHSSLIKHKSSFNINVVKKND